VTFTWAGLLGLGETPRRTAAAFALGVFFSFSPLLGLQIVLSMSLALFLRLNRLAVFAGLNANLPWIMVPWYAGTTAAAAAIIGTPLPADFRRELGGLLSLGVFSRDFWSQAIGWLRPFLVPFLVGPTIGAALIGAAAYPVTYAVLIRRPRV
jgi:uncharacterized protein